MGRFIIMSAWGAPSKAWGTKVKLWDIEMVAPKNQSGENLYDIMCSTNGKDIDDNYIIAVYGSNRINSMCTGLRNVGLGCKDNSYSNMLEYTKDVLSDLDGGRFFFFSNGDEKKYPADFQIARDRLHEHDKLSLLFSDSYIDQLPSH